jgi:protein-tyrosine phosphatase
VTPFRILHVCTGNICRSPMAEHLMRAGLEQRLGPRAVAFQVASAGTLGFVGEMMQPFTGTTLAARGVNGAAFRARRLNEDLIAGADLVLGATREHRAAVVTLHPRASRRTFTLREFDRLLSAVDPASLPTGDLRARAEAVVAGALAHRGLIRPPAPEDDDIADPYQGPEEGYLACGVLLDEVLARPLALLTGR